VKEWALVTGGTRNIGEAISRRLLADGFNVLVTARNKPDHDGFSEFVPSDLTDPEGAATVLKAAIGNRQVTRFVHNAGIADTHGVEDVPISEIGRLYAVNAVSFVAVSQIVIPIMRTAGVGRIVAIGSRAALGKLNRTAYSASKAALSGIVRTMALELGSDGITVNVVAPGPINTSLFRASTTPGSADWKNLTYGVPVGFVGEGEDVAHSVSYFVSDQARFTTGQVLYVCGGTSVGFMSPEGRHVDHKFAAAYPVP
jgi:3-oxoacyl-[acyl-carrier protein] reductase